jgi:hypothetical protein
VVVDEEEGADVEDITVGLDALVQSTEDGVALEEIDPGAAPRERVGRHHSRGTTSEHGHLRRQRYSILPPSNAGSASTNDSG